jgi:sorbitol/mannitol transport system substrate-binding protein
MAAPLLASCGGGGDNQGGGGGGGDLSGTEITVAAVNNPQMEDIQSLVSNFNDDTGITVNFQFLPENDLRQRVTQDVSLDAGNFDVVMISSYETPIWAQNGWITSLEEYFGNLGQQERDDYDRNDILQTWRTSLSFEDELYSIPFYGESSMLYYRKDLFEQAGIQMPDRPTWEQVTGFAEELSGGDVSGIALRGLPGWGANMAAFDTFINTYGGRWYNENWEPQLDSDEVRAAIESYTNLGTNYAQSSIASDNFPECLNIFSSGNAAMWYDATVAGGLLSDSENSDVVDTVGFAYGPTAKVENGAHWLYSWALSIESASKNKEAAFEFIKWATSKGYIQLAGEELGWERVPPGTRQSTYDNTPYGENAWTDIELSSIEEADPNNPTEEPVPYTGIQYIVIPEFQQLGDSVGRSLAGVLSGDTSVEEMQQQAQQEALRVAREGEYLEG